MFRAKGEAHASEGAYCCVGKQGKECGDGSTVIRKQMMWWKGHSLHRILKMVFLLWSRQGPSEEALVEVLSVRIMGSEAQFCRLEALKLWFCCSIWYKVIYNELTAKAVGLSFFKSCHIILSFLNCEIRISMVLHACWDFKTVVIKFFNLLIYYHRNKTDISKHQGKLHWIWW